jgi:hypothetical protein
MYLYPDTDTTPSAQSHSEVPAESSLEPTSHASPLTTPSKTVLEISKLKAARDERRALASAVRASEEGMETWEKENKLYVEAIEKLRASLLSREDDGENEKSRGLRAVPEMGRIRVYIRKRPLNSRGTVLYIFHINRVLRFAIFYLERQKNQFDIVTSKTSVSKVYIHEPKTRVDLSKAIETHAFMVDAVFDETAKNHHVYERTMRDLVDSLFRGSMSTFFAYGQTG